MSEGLHIRIIENPTSCDCSNNDFFKMSFKNQGPSNAVVEENQKFDQLINF